jgi:predicted DNA-binding protein
MKKDVVYSIRMSVLVRESLKRAAREDRRTVASLLDKIILDYLENELNLQLSETGADRRGFKAKKDCTSRDIDYQNRRKNRDICVFNY